MESMGIFTVNEDGSIDIPAELLENLGYGPDELPLMEVTVEGLVIHKKKPKAHKKSKTLRTRI